MIVPVVGGSVLKNEASLHFPGAENEKIHNFYNFYPWPFAQYPPEQRDINQNKPYNVTTQDMQNIRTELATMFKEILVNGLNEIMQVAPGRQEPSEE